MKIASLIITYLVGLLFVLSAVIYFFHLVEMPVIPGDAGTFGTILNSSGYMIIIKILEISIGAMLLVNFKRQLAWLLLLPINVNIAIFEVLLSKQPSIGIALLVLNFFMIYVNREHYKGLVS